MVNAKPPNNEHDGELIIDLAEYAKAGKTPPSHCAGYRIRIGKQTYVVTRAQMTGRQLLEEVAQLTPAERYRLDQKFCGGQTQRIGLNDCIDFTKPGVERFLTMPLDQTEGYTIRRQFRLPETDEEWLQASGLVWETILEGNQQWLILQKFALPTGYSLSQANVGLRIPTGYPDAQIDMAYFSPALSRQDGQKLHAISSMQLDGKVWQRWSRHRTRQNPWVPGQDYIGTHLGLVECWLEQALIRR